ncbi:MAG TPA: Rne/Rng family ribonuclease [Mycobacteriales bacterium]|nr:Rne/Rng family ribonuclease [Mycobacteriales bacterium]
MPEIPTDRPARRSRARAPAPVNPPASADGSDAAIESAKPKRARATKATKATTGAKVTSAASSAEGPHAPESGAANSSDDAGAHAASADSPADVTSPTSSRTRRRRPAQAAPEDAPAADARAEEAPPAPASRRRRRGGADPAAASAGSGSTGSASAESLVAASFAAVPPAEGDLEELDPAEADIDTPDEWAFAAKPIAASPTRRPASPPPAVAFKPPAVTFAAPPVVTAVDEVASLGSDDSPRQAPGSESPASRSRTRRPRIAIEGGEPSADFLADDALVDGADGADARDAEGGVDDEAGERSRSRRRRGRRGRGRGKGSDGAEEFGGSGDSAGEEAPDSETAAASAGDTGSSAADDDDDTEAGSSRRRRRRRRGGGGGEGAEPSPDDPPRTVVRVREPREPREPRKQQAPREDDGVRGVGGSTRLEAKRQRRRDGRSSSRRPSIVTESEFLARREAVERTMLVRQTDDRTQIAVLEDGVLVEHYVTKASATSYAGNVYLGRVQNVLPSMEAAFVDVGKGRNAVLYAGEVNYDASALEGRAPRIEQALKSGQQVLVQVTKDPIGHKGARLTSQISLPGRYMVYVPEQSMTGISRKLPDTERARLKSILKALKPEGAGIIIRTAAEGASEEDLTRDLDRLKAQWEVIEKKAKKESAPTLLHAEPDLVIKVIRDNFNEDFSALVVEAGTEYDLIEGYLSTLAPDLLPRLTKYDGDVPLFESYRVNEQLHKALDRKVSLPSGGSLVIDRTEAMTVVDVNTGKFTGKGGNLEETVTRNNLEAAEEIVRQLRLRDVGGIIVVDFIDMILESNRELVTRRLTECLGRDRTKHQVAEITSLGLLQMTRKRISQGLLESFSEECSACSGRGVVVHQDLLAPTVSKGRGRRSGPSPASVAAAAGRSRGEVDSGADATPGDVDLADAVPADGAVGNGILDGNQDVDSVLTVEDGAASGSGSDSDVGDSATVDAANGALI